MAVKTVTHVIAGDVADDATFAVNYPTGYSAASFNGTNGRHYMIADGGTYSIENGLLAVSFGASSITVTNQTGRTIANGTRVVISFERLAEENAPNPLLPSNVAGMSAHRVLFGAVATADADGVAAVQTFAEADDFTLDGALVNSDGVAVFATPRNVTATVATSNHSARTITVTGTDQYDAVVVESFAGPNANTVAGKKAFKTVTNVAIDGAAGTNGISIGTGDVLGLPFFVPAKAHILAATIDGTDEIATSTFVAGVTATPSATTGDVRGTLDFATATNGTRILEAVVLVSNPLDRGMTQYGG